MKSTSANFDALRSHIDDIPVIETHEHYDGLCAEDPELDVLSLFLGNGYYRSDLNSAGFDFDRSEHAKYEVWALSDKYLLNQDIPLEQRYEVWQQYRQRSCHTGYAQGTDKGMEACWQLTDTTLDSLLALQERARAERNQAFYDAMYEKYHISKMIVNVAVEQYVIDGRPYHEDRVVFVLDLPQYHSTIHSKSDLLKPHLQNLLGRHIISLDDYLEAFEIYLKKCVDFGIVGMKDQSAYHRVIDYRNVTRGEAELVFNKLIANPRLFLGFEEVRPLDDFLFHQFMRLAAKYQLPVQIHTGHMAGIQNEIRKTNPANLTGVMEIHQDVVFDLFHGGWPYMGEFLYLGKNYPNAMLDMCWANAIDPLYAVEFFKRSLATVPHSKVMGFGGDTGSIETQIGYLIQARENIATALAEMIDRDWLDLDAAKQVAEDWLFHNPNRIFNLGLTMD